MSAFGLYNSFYSCWHAIDITSAEVFIEAVPFSVDPFPKLIDISGMGTVRAETKLQLVPNMLNWIQVETLRRPIVYVSYAVVC